MAKGPHIQSIWRVFQMKLFPNARAGLEAVFPPKHRVLNPHRSRLATYHLEGSD